MRTIRIVTLMLALFVSLPAAAATIRAANNCSGVPAPCTTSLQGALDNTSYSRVDIVANATFTGEYFIERSLTLAGASGSTIQRGTSSVYALRVETTSAVNVQTLAIYGRVAVYDSVDVDFLTCDVVSADSAFQILDSDDVQVRTSNVVAAHRALDVTDSTNVLINGGVIDSSLYGVVASSSDISMVLGDLTGDDRAVVLQHGTVSTYPTLTANGSTLTSNPGRAQVWRWTRGSTSYTNMSPAPSEYVSSSSQLVSPLSFTPHQGG
ncbi:MAG: hypothetical protein R3F39_05870 [Myxococcota bacterium]